MTDPDTFDRPESSVPVLPPAVKFSFIGLFAGYLIVALLARGQTLGNPVLGFDEQFYLLVGDRMWQGALPYVDIWDRKPIGLFLIYAAARALGGAGFVEYKLVAMVFVAATASLVARFSGQFASRTGALLAGLFYILWLNFTECEGGQAEVFFALPMVLAAWLTWLAWHNGDRIPERAALAMVLTGVALQIKYSVVLEGAFLGVVLLAARYRRDGFGPRLLGQAVLQLACAVAPTALAMVWYWRLGHLSAFMFANFGSIQGRNALPLWMEAQNYAAIAGIFLPLIVAAAIAWKRKGTALSFPLWWGLVATIEMILIGQVGSPHYAAEILLPACILAGAAFAGTRASRRWGAGLALLMFVAGQGVLFKVAAMKGGAREAEAVARAAAQGDGCIYVYDGYPALYMLTHSCLPTRYPFPGHLNSWAEASARALGTDPAAEVARILRSRPKAIIDDWPVYDAGNPVNHALVLETLRRDYDLVARVRTGKVRFRLVYRLRAQQN